MKTRSLVSFAMAAMALMTVAGCSSSSVSSSEVVEETAQGVTATTVTVGNTAAVTGPLAAVGIPFNIGINAALEEVNEAGGVGGRTINFVTYDDTFNAALGVQKTEQLVEDDEVFALVGHFGTPTVGATIDYIQDKGIPMVYAATGINQLYFQRTPGNPVMAVQPIYKTEGRILLARVYSETDLFGAVDKVGVIYTSDDAGLSIKAGIDVQALSMGKGAEVVSVAGSGDFSAAALALLTAAVDVVIIATNQGYFPTALAALAANEVNVPVLTSYVSANPYYIANASVSEARPVYTNAWVDVSSEDVADEVTAFAATINAYSALTPETAPTYVANSFAIAGYIAAKIFIEGLRRVDANGEVLTWAHYIAAMEESTIDFPLGGQIDFTDGKRWGVDALSLLKYNKTTSLLEVSKPIETLAEILA